MRRKNITPEKLSYTFRRHSSVSNSATKEVSFPQATQENGARKTCIQKKGKISGHEEQNTPSNLEESRDGSTTTEYTTTCGADVRAGAISYVVVADTRLALEGTHVSGHSYVKSQADGIKIDDVRGTRVIRR